ncbi:MAG: tetratricopeptide repeat protein [Nitrospirae bacterium]|nr:tetratricopeptide repeat protein [Nitrospirota bacterium]
MEGDLHQEKPEGHNVQEGAGNRGGKGGWNPPVYLWVILGLLIVVPIGFYIKEKLGGVDPAVYLQQTGVGKSYFEQGKFPEAEKELKKAVEMDPDRFEAHYGLALAHLKMRQLEPAAREFTKALEIKPDIDEAHYSLGVTYQRMGRYEEALKEYKWLFENNRNNVQVYNNVAMIHLEMKSFDKAVLALQTAIQLKPDFYTAHLNLGKVYTLQGKPELARQIYKKVQKEAAKKPETAAYVKAAEERLAMLSRTAERRP